MCRRLSRLSQNSNPVAGISNQITLNRGCVSTIYIYDVGAFVSIPRTSIPFYADIFQQVSSNGGVARSTVQVNRDVVSIMDVVAFHDRVRA